MTNQQDTPLPTTSRPEALRMGLTVALTFNEDTGRPVKMLFDGFDDAGVPMHLSLSPGDIIRLATYCARTLPEDER